MRVSGAKASLESSPRVTVWVAARARGRRGRRRARVYILIWSLVIDGWGVKKRGWALGESQVMGLGELRGK
jgi:hypothetical protein